MSTAVRSRRSIWQRIARGPDLPRDIEAALVAPLFSRVASLCLAHLVCLGLCGIAMSRIGGAWPEAFLAANAAAMAAHLWVVLRVPRSGPPSRRVDALLRWRGPYQAVGLGWSALSGALCGVCLAVGSDEMTRLFCITLAIGMTGGIASRNAGTPRYAVAQIAAWLLPLAAACLLLGATYWLLAALLVIVLGVLCSVVLQHHSEMMSLISAERLKGALASRLDAAISNMTQGLVLFDAHGSLQVVNQRFHHLLGLPQDALRTGMDAAEVSAAWADAAIAATAMPDVIDLPDGRALATAQRRLPDGGRVLTVEDVTESRRAQLALAEREAELRAIFENAAAGVAEVDAGTGRLVRVNRVFSRMVGWSEEDLLAWFSLPELAHPDDWADEARRWAAICAGGQGFEAETRYLRRDGTTLWVRVSASAATIDARTGRPSRLVAIVQDVTERRLADARVAHLAHHDPLTDLPNRALFRVRLDEALAHARRGAAFAICCLDLDHFKDVNDTLGHPVGDALLQAVTARLRAELRPTDTVARLGGDEFAVIQSSVEQPGDATALAERLIASVTAPYVIDGHHVAIGISIGIAVAPGDGMDADALMRNADVALLRSKADGRGRYRLFELEMDCLMQARRTLEIDLRRALDADEFELFYQPLVSVAERTVQGFEALLRWRHPERGTIPPDRFIPLAEATGLLVPIGAWVLRRACAEAAGWPGAPRVAINLSAVQFASQALVDDVTAALRLSGLDPRRLELEITETAMLQDTEATLATLHRLKALGVGIAMDDFGTGYSSLSYLQRFPFDKVKIDRSFIASLGERRESSAIVGAVIDLCTGLDMTTTAEGVETEEQLAALARTGCTEAQGYLFSPPRPAREVETLMARLARPMAAALPMPLPEAAD